MLTNLQYYIENGKTVQDLVNLEDIHLNQKEKFKHYAYSLLVMAITKHFWNGNKNGTKNIEYPLNKKEASDFDSDSYLGHNIAAIAVDGNGKIIDYEFNHNKIYKSSVEHAETRLVKRIYSLSQLHEGYKLNNNNILKDNTVVLPEFSDTIFTKKDEAITFDSVSIYTSLESCSQCSGVMALAKVKNIIYLQVDPGMYSIGNILRNLTKKIDNCENGDLESPQPIRAELFNFKYKNKLEEAYSRFQAEQKPFEIRDKINKNEKEIFSLEEKLSKLKSHEQQAQDLIKGLEKLLDSKKVEGKRLKQEKDSIINYEEKLTKEVKPFAIETKKTGFANKYSSSMTSFLCTEEAFNIYDQAAKILDKSDKELISIIDNEIQLKKYGLSDLAEFEPLPGTIVQTKLEIVREIKKFFEYVKLNGSRATAHK